MDGLITRDPDLCLRVIEADSGVNEMQRAVSSMVSATIATQAPVAGDLRFLLTLDHVGYELERMGDHAASVAKQGRRLVLEPPLPVRRHALRDGAARGRLTTASSGRSWTWTLRTRARSRRPTTTSTSAITAFDDVLDLMRADPATVDRGARILLAAHALERIGDRVTNIAEDIVFLASGEVEDLNP